MKSKLFCAAAAVLLISGPVVAQDDTAYCSLPGQLVASDPSGDAALIAVPDPIPDHDIVDVYVAEVPNAAGQQKVSFTIKLSPAAPAPLPLTSYQVKFILKDGVERFMLYNPYPTPAAINPVTGLVISNSDLMFAFGHNDVDPTTGNSTFSIDGPADMDSSASADTITLVLNDTQLKGLQPGAAMTGIMGVSQFNGVLVTTDLDNSDVTGNYTLKGNASCGAASKSAAPAFGGGLGLGLLLPLLAAVRLRRRG